MIGFIYKITNSINSKIYIGQTTQSIKKRWCLHKKSESCRAISSAIKKYGADSFKIEIIEECKTLQELNDREAYWIKEINSLSPNGYNLTTGGNSKTASVETKLKMSEAYNNQELRNLISTISKKNWENPDYRENLSKKRREMWENPEYRSKMSKIRKDAHKNKELHEKLVAGIIRASRKRRKPVVMTDLDGQEYEFFSIQNAIDSLPDLKLIQSQISQCCIGNNKTHRKRKWRFKK